MVRSLRRLPVLAAPALGALVLSACWPVPGGNADRTAHNPLETALTTASVADLESAWVADLGPGASGPATVAADVYVRVGQQVSRVDLESGAVQWTWSLPDDVPDFASVSDPMAVGGRVHVGYGIGNLGGQWFGVALDPTTGVATGDPAARGLLTTARGTQVVGQTFSFGSGTPILESFGITDVATGVSTGGGRVAIHSFGGGGSPGHVTLGNAAAYHSGTGLVSGAPDWAMGSGVRAFPPGTPSTCAPSGANFLCPSWTTPLDATTDVVIGPGETTLYVGVGGGAVAALDAATGAVLWTSSVGADVTAAPALAAGVLFAPTADGDLVALDAASGGELWSAPIDGTALAQRPAVAGTGDGAVVFAGTQGGNLAAVAAAGCGAPTCATLWQAPVGSGVTGAPAISRGHVVVGTANGQVAAFGLPAP